jgi:hypothetical protein
MNSCRIMDPGTIVLHFYGELAPAEAARVDAHLRACPTCRQHMDDMGAIRGALAERPRVDAPPAGDWSGFTRRLDAALVAVSPAPKPTRRVMPWLAVAAAVIIAAAGVFVTSRIPRTGPAQQTALTRPVPSAAAAASGPAVIADRSLMEHSEEHFERSKLVVLGLATLDPHHARSADWEHERELAGSLLPDTRLYRLAAEDRGMNDLARVLGDLETVLLETSMTDHADRESLERVQHLIARRDLVVKMNVVGSGI